MTAYVTTISHDEARTLERIVEHYQRIIVEAGRGTCPICGSIAERRHAPDCPITEARNFFLRVGRPETAQKVEVKA